jgi:hypothetical protein
MKLFLVLTTGEGEVRMSDVKFRLTKIRKKFSSVSGCLAVLNLIKDF